MSIRNFLVFLFDKVNFCLKTIYYLYFFLQMILKTLFVKNLILVFVFLI
jgi:hypothetical protein